jgi:hypothetical protein
MKMEWKWNEDGMNVILRLYKGITVSDMKRLLWFPNYGKQ